MEGSGSTRGWAGKGQLKADEFRRYLEGPRSHRDPRFDLKVFQWVSLLLLRILASPTLFSPVIPLDPPPSWLIAFRNRMVADFQLGNQRMSWDEVGERWKRSRNQGRRHGMSLLFALWSVVVNIMLIVVLQERFVARRTNPFRS
jgi:hypothetical protein